MHRKPAGTGGCPKGTDGYRPRPCRYSSALSSHDPEAASHTRSRCSTGPSPGTPRETSPAVRHSPPAPPGESQQIHISANAQSPPGKAPAAEAASEYCAVASSLCPRSGCFLQVWWKRSFRELLPELPFSTSAWVAPCKKSRPFPRVFVIAWCQILIQKSHQTLSFSYHSVSQSPMKPYLEHIVSPTDSSWVLFDRRLD